MKTPKNKSQASASFEALTPINTVKENFLAAYQIPEGSNSILVDDTAQVISSIVTSGMASFSFVDVVRLLRNRDYYGNNIKTVFDAFVDTLIKEKRVKPMVTIYDEPLFAII